MPLSVREIGNSKISYAISVPVLYSNVHFRKLMYFQLSFETFLFTLSIWNKRRLCTFQSYNCNTRHSKALHVQSSNCACPVNTCAIFFSCIWVSLYPTRATEASKTARKSYIGVWHITCKNSSQRLYYSAMLLSMNKKRNLKNFTVLRFYLRAWLNGATYYTTTRVAILRECWRLRSIKTEAFASNQKDKRILDFVSYQV